MNELTLHCPNPFCKQANDAAAIYCGACQTVLPHHYLWAVGNLGQIPAGTLIHDRYALIGDQVLLDCRPGMSIEVPYDISLKLEAYLKLSHYSPHLPKVYSVFNHQDQEIILLEETAIYPARSVPEDTTRVMGTIMPSLKSVWSETSDFRRLNWVYQLSQLWEPLERFDALSTLFQPDFIRVDQDTIKLLQLDINSQKSYQLIDFLKLLLDYEATEKSITGLRIRDLIDRLIHESEDEQSFLLTEWLDQELIHYTDGSLTIEICTLTDQGPNRNRNEDTCFPSGQKLSSVKFDPSDSAKPVLIVCDGIGGHEGGNVASELAVEQLRAAISEEIQSQSDLDVVQVIKSSIRAANDIICERNDTEGRTERQRMGTTVVLARLEGRKIQIAHVGDSRAYRITRSGCTQLTCDDDVASREVRLGYTLYREALQHTSSGALTQALGMVSSSLLHPTVRSWFVDEDSIFLLCSDGLSDFDRVEESWAQELLPVLEGRLSLASACQALVEIANARNGHDNVTVGLMHCQLGKSATWVNRDSLRHKLANRASRFRRTRDRRNSSASERTALSRAVTQPVLVVTEQKDSLIPWRRWLGLMALCAILGVIGGFLWMRGRSEFGALSNVPMSPSTPTVTPLTLPELKVKQVVRLSGEPGREGSGVLLNPEPGVPTKVVGDPLERTKGALSGTIVEVVERRLVQPDGEMWVKFRVCQAEGDSPQLVKPGDEGWHAEKTVLPMLELQEGVTCAVPTKEKR